MRRKAITVLNDYKEILIVMIAAGTIVAGVITANPRHTSAPVTLEQVMAKLDSMSARVDAIARLQCSRENRETLQLAGVHCP